MNPLKTDTDYRTGSLFLRGMGVTMTHDFDRMTDKVRLWSRSAPWRSMERGGFTFDKLVTGVDLPAAGTAEREGADLILGMLAVFLESHE